MNTALLLSCVIIFFAVWWFCLLLTKPSSFLYTLDEVIDRSLHNQPKPCTGGVALVGVIILAWSLSLIFIAHNFHHYFVLFGFIIISFVSYLDDRNPLPSAPRLVVHFVAAILMVISLFYFSSNSLVENVGRENFYIIGFVFVMMTVWSINLYNFMDGADGIAAGMGVVGFGCLAWFGWYSHHQLFFALTAMIAAANMGFLVHNYPPAKLFMGDVGSTAMGYLMAFFSIWGLQDGIFPWWIPLLIFSPFIVDTSVTLIRRIFSKERIWEAHKSHYYQKLVGAVGLGHTKTAILEYFLMVSLALSSVILHIISSALITMIFLFVWMVIYLFIIILIDRFYAKSGVIG